MIRNSMEENDELIIEMQHDLAAKIQKEVEEYLQKYKAACLALKMSIHLDANINIVHYSGNGRRSNRPMTIAEVGVGYNTSGVTNWND